MKILIRLIKKKKYFTFCFIIASLIMSKTAFVLYPWNFTKLHAFSKKKKKGNKRTKPNTLWLQIEGNCIFLRKDTVYASLFAKFFKMWFLNVISLSLCLTFSLKLISTKFCTFTLLYDYFYLKPTIVTLWMKLHYFIVQWGNPKESGLMVEILLSVCLGL